MSAIKSHVRLALIASGLSLAGCTTETFPLEVQFVVPDGQSPFEGLEYLSLTTAYDDGREYSFFVENPAGDWVIDELPAADAVTFTFEGLVGDPLASDGTSQTVAASGTFGPRAIGPDTPAYSCLFSRRGLPGRLPSGLASGRAYGAWAQLAGGDFVVLGGDDSATVERFSTDGGPGAWSFRLAGALRGARAGFTATPIEGTGTTWDGKVLVLGTQEFFDPSTGEFGDLSASALDSALGLALPEFWDPATDAVESFGSQAPQSLGWLNRAYHQATLLPGGKVLITGGLLFRDAEVAATSLAPAFVNLNTGEVGPYSSGMREARFRHTATLLADGRVLLVGSSGIAAHGTDDSGTAEIYDPAVDSFSLTAGEIDPPRGAHGATLLADGRVLVFGGATNRGSSVLRDAWLYDPDANTWTESASELTTPRSGAVGTLLADGRVAICGGTDGEGPAEGCELYSPSHDSFAPVADPNHLLGHRDGAAVGTLPGGELIVVGGSGFTGADTVVSHLSDAVVYNP